MKKGFYVRCPLYIEAADYEYPRCFMLARVIEYNEMSEEYTVEPCDLLGTSEFYLSDNPVLTFSADKIERCAGAIGGTISCAMGRGYIIAHNEPGDTETPYQYYVKLVSGKFIVLDELHLQIDYTQMDYSPLKQLMNYEFQNPSWYASRLNVSRNVNFINNASYGFKSMAGSRIFMLPHQVSTVARCFEFMPIRYMLADEVGLGKTIEAGSIIRILVDENKNLNALFVVPGALLNQWKTELIYKFSLSKELERGQLKLVALEEYSRFSNSLSKRRWDILIIDETHRLLKDDALYSLLLKQSIDTPNILLLSATPIQDRKAEYHKLLSLLLPDQYLEMQEERFSELVDKEKKIQKSVKIILRRMDDFEDFEEDIIERIDNINESLNDSRLDKMVDVLHKTDLKEPVVQDIISYICENYRLERRVIRNRRGAINTDMPKRKLIEIPYMLGTADEFYDETEVVNAVMNYLSEQENEDVSFITKVAQPMLSSVYSSPWAYRQCLHELQISDDYLHELADKWVVQGEQELRQANEILDESPERIKSRILRIVDYIEQETDVVVGQEKVVVFTAFTETLEKAYEVLHERLNRSEVNVVAFSKNMSRDELENSVFEFQNNKNCKVIICDETGGEGRNFQNAKRIIHIDLPWTANALEQRIGRLDRLGRDADNDVISVAIYAKNTTDEQLLEIWRDGMEVFTQSLSGMEIITGELNSLIAEAMLDDYYNGLGNAIPDILETMEEMREAVEDEQEFDIGAVIYQPLTRAVGEMLQTYLEGENSDFAHSMLTWGSQVGLKVESNKTEGLLVFNERSFQTRSAIQSLFAPPDWRKYDGSSIVRRERRLRGTFSRKIAIEREDLLFFAPNDSVYDAISQNAMGCSRGRCCATMIKGDFNYSGFVFTYVAQPNIKMLLEKNVSPRVLSQFRLFMPQRLITVYLPLTEESRNVGEKTLDALFKQTWRLRNGKHLGRRGGNESPLERFMYMHPEEQWGNLVAKANKSAIAKAKEKFLDEADLVSAKKEVKRLIAGRRAEYLYFDKDTDELDEAIEMYKVIWEALRTSELVLDSVCFLRVQKDG